MRITISLLTLVALFTSLGLAQAPKNTGSERTFPVTTLTSKADLTSLVTALRTVVDIQDLQPDLEHSAVIARSTADKLVAADWFIHQLDQPAGSDGVTASPDYKMTDAQGEVMRVFRLPDISQPTLTNLVTAIRTVSDLQRLMPMEGPKAIAARGSLEKVNSAEWMLRELVPIGGKTLTGDSSAYPMAKDRPEADDETIRVFRMDPSTTNATLTGMVTAIRTVADLQRLMPIESGKAIVARGSADKIALAEWLMHHASAPAPSGPVEMTALDPRNQYRGANVVRIFFVHGTDVQITGLVTSIRETASIQRLMPLTAFGAIVARGQADQISTAQLLVDRFSSGGAPANAQLK